MKLFIKAGDVLTSSDLTDYSPEVLTAEDFASDTEPMDADAVSAQADQAVSRSLIGQVIPQMMSMMKASIECQDRMAGMMDKAPPPPQTAVSVIAPVAKPVKKTWLFTVKRDRDGLIQTIEAKEK